MTCLSRAGVDRANRLRTGRSCDASRAWVVPAAGLAQRCRLKYPHRLSTSRSGAACCSLSAMPGCCKLDVSPGYTNETVAMRILDQLGSGEGLPIEAIRAATADRSTVAPLLLEAIDRCEPTGEVEEKGLFIAFHLLGQWREKSAYRTLARFLRRP